MSPLRTGPIHPRRGKQDPLRAEGGAEAPKSRTSAAQWAANRRNPQRSTGPRTEEGKQASSRNAMRHGAYARPHPVPRGILAEDPDEVQGFFDAVVEELTPRSTQEQALARRIANAELNLARIAATRVSGSGGPDGSAGSTMRMTWEQSSPPVGRPTRTCSGRGSASRAPLLHPTGSSGLVARHPLAPAEVQRLDTIPGEGPEPLAGGTVIRPRSPRPAAPWLVLGSTPEKRSRRNPVLLPT